MTCSEFLHRYSDYDDSLLTPGEEARFRAHLRECRECARYDRVLRKGRMLARQVAAEPSRDFMPRLHRRILTAPSPAPVPGPLAAGGFLTLALVAVMGAWLMDAGPAPVVGAERPLRTMSLPPTAQVGPADWTMGGVARAAPSSYSPLEIGPPAYRAPRSVSTGLTSATSRTLD